MPAMAIPTTTPPSTAPRAAIFDMDGVLTDSEPLICDAAIAMFGEHGVSAGPDDFKPFVGTGENRYIGGVAERYGVKLDLVEAKRRTYELYLAMVPQRLHAFPGAVDLVQRCRAAGLRTAVASSADWIKVAANLEAIGLPPAGWDAVVTAEKVERRKPAPDVFLAAARLVGIPPDRCTVIEDAINGIEAARAAGMRCIAVAQSFPASELARADRIRPTIAAVTLADLM